MFKQGRVGSSRQKASCSKENRPTEPGSVIDMEWSSPSTLCQSFVAIVLYSEAMDSRISRRCSMRCGGSAINFAVVSMSNPRMTLDVVHVASPCFIVLIDAGSWRKALSLLPSGQNTLSSKRRRICLTHWQVYRFPCTKPQKLSSYISQYHKGFLKGVVHGMDGMWPL